MNIPPEHDPEAWAALEPYERDERRHNLWLERSVTWSGIPGAWTPVRVLGHGGYGLCGLFRNTRNDTNLPSHIVVKQSGRPDRNLRNESRLLRMFGELGCTHIVKLYKSYHREGGTGTSDDFDPHPFTNVPDMGDIYTSEKEVSRIYLEYCARGDLSKWIQFLRHERRVLTEANVWRVFQCLAYGALALEQGHEGEYDPQLPHRPVAHFDIKPTNILVQSKDDDHQHLGIFKFADFGLSRFVPQMQSPAWFQYADWRYTTGYGTPEQIYTYHDNRYIGTPCNIWGVGALMYALVMPDPRIPHELFYLHFWDGEDRAPIRTMGHPLLDHQACSYSRFFRQTVLTCLAFDPAQRPGPRALLAHCRDALAALAVDALGGTLPPAFFVADGDVRLGLQPPDEGRVRERPEYVGETYVVHGPEVDELGFGPGERAAAAAPVWQPVLPSPPGEAEGEGRRRFPEFVTAEEEVVAEATVLHAGFDVPGGGMEGELDRFIGQEGPLEAEEGDVDVSMEMEIDVSSGRSRRMRSSEFGD